MYERLYADAQIFDELDGFLDCPGSFAAAQDHGIQTSVVGQKPDIEQYRNFVSLDTRSREIRNRSLDVQGMPKVDNGDGISNLVIRRYKSSM